MDQMMAFHLGSKPQRVESDEPEQRVLENLDAWARRGDAWVKQTVAILTRKLLDRDRTGK